VVDALLPRHAPVDDHLAVRGDEDAGEHLDRRRFACAVRAEVAHQLARLNGERHAVDGAHNAILAREQVADRAARASLPQSVGRRWLSGYNSAR